MKKIIKSWGWEHWFSNNERYCGKVIYIRFSRWSSKGKYHYHKLKDKTFFVITGKLRVDYFELVNLTKQAVILSPGDSFRVPPGMKHRFTPASKEHCKFIEAASVHKDDDIYRGDFDSEGAWIE